MNRENLENLLNIMRPRDKMIFSMIYHYALNVTEFLNITLDDIDLTERTLKIIPLKIRSQSGQLPYVYEIPGDIKKLIENYLPERPDSLFSNLVITDYYSLGQHYYRPMTRQNISNIFTNYCNKFDINASPKNLRDLRREEVKTWGEPQKAVNLLRYVRSDYLLHI